MIALEANTEYDESQIRTPAKGVFFGYLAACLIVSAGPGVVFESESGFKVEEFFYVEFWRTVLIIALVVPIICAVPFVALRFTPMFWKPYRMWKHAMAGALLGCAFSALFGTETYRIVGFWVCGACGGTLAFIVEQRFRLLRLNEILAVDKSHARSESQLTTELEKARPLGSTSPKTDPTGEQV